MNKLNWEDEGHQIVLRDGRRILARARNMHELGWYVYLPCIDQQFYSVEANTIEEAEWQVTLLLYDLCNKKANYYHTIRDNLPSIHELAKNAGI